ncbi:cytochrome c [Microaerobacter geothermalis]|uniref:c-type cytochrome n=1 Tax=Microaerobacter geothermalis TaxID=674972 RepID=UPI001F4026E1|nr:cytochrome c [Microaerobacter geothermalis]MCF6093018.1 cytochrome c [Microaerobacter geothermalis]
MKNLIIYVGGGVVLLLLFFATAFTTVDAGLPADHGSPYWGTSEVEVAGAKLFKQAGCTSCHSYRGQQGQVTGPELDTVGLRLNEQAIEQFIRRGTQIMPSYEGKLSDDEIKTLATWLSSFKTPAER